jgi:hypothetical protein
LFTATPLPAEPAAACGPMPRTLHSKATQINTEPRACA